MTDTKTRYKVRVYIASALGFFTQADHFEDYYFTSDEPLSVFAKRLASDGFSLEGGKKWVMPSAILTVEIDQFKYKSER